MVIFVMAFFLLFITGSLVFSQLELKKASNLKFATQAVETADAGLQHALSWTALPWGWNFNAQLSCGTPPCTVVAQTTFPSGSGFSYTVTAKNDVADSGGSVNDTNKILVLASTASGPSGTKRVVEAYVKRSLVSFIPPGALYLSGSSVTVKFDDGSGIFITGNDTGYNGSPAVNPQPAVMGVAALSDNTANNVKNALGSNRYNLVQGSGYSPGPPVTPSVFKTGNVFDVDQLAVMLYNNPTTVKYLNGLSLNCPSSSPCTLGTDAAPQITYLKQSASNSIRLDGYVSGSGMLVAEGKTDLLGNFNFHGLLVKVAYGVTGVVTSGLTGGFNMDNNAMIFGALLRDIPPAGSDAISMGKNAKIYYSSRALTQVNTLWGSLLPQPPRVFAWLDK